MAKFDFIHNRVFDDRISAFAPQTPQGKPGSDMRNLIPMGTGTVVHENGDVDFGLYAPNAKAVSLVFGVRASQPMPMEKDDDGVWRVTLPFDPKFCGPKAFTFNVDGAEMVSPYCSQYYSHSKAINYVEIPDPNAEFVLMRNVPHGAVTTEYYWSDSLETWQRCLVYTPPMYHQGGEYPVLYLQHGAGENETSWVYNGKAGHILDNLIADGKAKPMLIVMNDGMVRGKNENPMSGSSAFASTLLDNCIPYIESKYRVKKDQGSRAIAGFSMGSMQSCVIGLTHLDTFSHIGLFSGFMRTLGSYQDETVAAQANPHLDVMGDAAGFQAKVKLFYRAVGSDDGHVNAFLADDELCKKGGYDQYPNVTRRVFQDYPHDWSVMRLMLHDFAQLLFRD